MDEITIWADSFAIITQNMGGFGVLLFIVMYIVVVQFFIPITPFTLAAGALYGWWGILIAYSGAVSAALVGFLLARTSLRQKIQKFCEKRPLAKAIDNVLEKGGFRLVLLVRLSGILPFTVQNYCFGLSKVEGRSYFFATLIGLVPGAVIKVWIGKVGMDALHMNDFYGFLQIGMLVIALLISFVMLIYVGKLAIRELRLAGVLDA